MMTSRPQTVMVDADLGRRGEDLAVAFLEELGYHVLDRNYRFERREVDVVCFAPAEDDRLGGEIVFVEVKTRSGDVFGRPEEAVGHEKQERVIEAARAYLYEKKLEGASCRFDVVSVMTGPSGPEIEHFPDAFWS